MSKLIKISDKLNYKDNSEIVNLSAGSCMWAKTDIIAGYGLKETNGITTLNEVVFRKKNIVPIGGVSYTMEKLFGVPETQITVPTLYTENGIGKVNSGTPQETYDIPGGTKNIIYRYGHTVCLFGVGITATAENDITIYQPDYREKNINLTRTNHDGLTVHGTMLPFRYTTETLDSDERLKYFGKKVHSNGVTGYYLKRFDKDPVIKHVWKTGEDIEDQELIADVDVWENMSGNNSVESYTEIQLSVSPKDIKEWFINIEQPDRTRINTIALFNGQFVPGVDGADYGDYRDVRLFSKLCMNPEYLDRSKDLYILYRVYGS